ncbi:MAG TPA: hypothetical protein VLJ59_07475 [Mycobacteriales bacterium]|nr:hypothetical protein [Mycobacteriales bacterium]
MDQVQPGHGGQEAPASRARNPDPPSPEEAVRIIDGVWAQDATRGTFVWLTMVTGMCRGELLALRWHDDDVDLVGGMLEVRRNYVWLAGRGIEKDTKTHQMRRIALDTATVDVSTAHRQQHEAQVRQSAWSHPARRSCSPTRQKPKSPSTPTLLFAQIASHAVAYR